MFHNFLVEPVCFGLNRVLDAGINPELSITILVGWTMSVGGPSSGAGVGREAVPKPSKNTSTVSTLTPPFVWNA